MYGLFFYTLAIPTVITSLLAYNVNFSSVFPDWLVIKYPNLFDIQNHSMGEDQEIKLMLFYNKYKSDTPGWRQKFMWWANWLPVICLLVDIIINKLKIYAKHIAIVNIQVTLYFIIMYCLMDTN